MKVFTPPTAQNHVFSETKDQVLGSPGYHQARYLGNNLLAVFCLPCLPIQVQGFNSTESNPTNLTDNDKQGKEREKRKRKRKEQYYYNVC